MGVNVACLLEEAARRWPDKRVVFAEGESLDWSTLERRAGAFAAMLAGRGIGRGDRIALHVPDRLEFVVALFGGLKAGAAVAPLNLRLTADERDAVLKDLDPALVVETAAPDEAEYAAAAVEAADPAIILYTSGSTGAPKGVLLSHAGTAFALDSWKGPAMGLVEDDVVLSALPLAHSLGIFGSLMAPLLAGASVVFLPRFTPEDAVRIVADRKVTVFPGVATMFRRILDSDAVAGGDFSSLRYSLSGAAPCPWELAEAWKAATGVRIVRGYGMTELFRPISFSPDDPRDDPDSIGRAAPGVDLRIVDDDGGDLAVGEAGELWIRSPARMIAYLNRPEETREVLDGAWFKTGDLATVSDDGFVRIVGRKKDMILRGGYTVAAGEVEAVLMTHPAIAEAAVVGVPHDELGEDIAAFVAFEPGAGAPAQDIIDYCRERMAGYKYPRHVRVRDELPRGPTGKVLKGQLTL